MTSAASCFSISRAVIREDFRRYRAVPVLALVAYLLCTAVPVFILKQQISVKSDSLFSYYSYVASIVNNSNPLVLMTTMWVPLLSGVMVFRYLHHQSSTVEVHSQPFTRGCLYRSHIASGVLFCVLPVLISGLVLMILSGPVYVTDNFEVFTTPEMAEQMGLSASAIQNAENIYQISDVVRWMMDTLIQTLFALSISIVSGIVTGTTVHHVIAAAGFNMTLPVLYLFSVIYLNQYLFGYNMNDYEGVSVFSPFTKALSGHLNPFWIGIYLLISAVLLAAGYGLYRRLQIERTTEGIVFDFVRIFVELLFGFLGMTILGYGAYVVFAMNTTFQAAGYVAGAFLGILFARMVVMKSFRVMDRGFFKLVGVYTVLAVLFFLCIGLDLFGVEQRIPADGTIDSVVMSGDSSETDFCLSGVGDLLTLEQDESIQLVRELHQELIDHKKDFLDVQDEYDATLMHLTFNYYKNGKDGNKEHLIEEREYTVPKQFLYQSSAYRKLKSCSEYREKRLEYLNFLKENLTSATLNAGDSIPDSKECQEYTLSAEQAGELMECVKKDAEITDSDRLMERMEANKLVYINIYYPEKSDSVEEYNTVKTLCITSKHNECVRWLKENGFLDEMEQSALSACSFAAVTRISRNALLSSIPDYIEKHVRAEENSQTRIFSDPEQIRQLYENYLTSLPEGKSPSDYAGTDEYYYVSFCTHSGDSSDLEYYYTYGYIRADQIP